jgi:hypothetical protein
MACQGKDWALEITVIDESGLLMVRTGSFRKVMGPVLE